MYRKRDRKETKSRIARTSDFSVTGWDRDLRHSLFLPLLWKTPWSLFPFEEVMERGCVNHGSVIRFAPRRVHRQSTTLLRAVIESTVKSASKLESPVPDCKPHITLHYSIWRLTSACKYELSRVSRTYRARARACDLSLSRLRLCEIVTGDERLLHYRHIRAPRTASTRTPAKNPFPHFSTARVALFARKGEYP